MSCRKLFRNVMFFNHSVTKEGEARLSYTVMLSVPAESPALNMLTMFITFAKGTQRFEPFRDLNSAESPLKY